MLSADQSKFATTCEEDEEGNLVLLFPDDLLETMGWHEGTVLDINVIAGQISIRESAGSTPSET